MKNIKVAGIGLQKTGTSSLAIALEILGFSTKHFVPEMICRSYYKEGAPQCELIDFNLENKFQILEKYDAVTDTPVCFPEIYKKLDEQYENIKFIYTTRYIGGWLKSVETHSHKKRYQEKFKKRLNTYKHYNPDVDLVFSCDSIGFIEYMYKVPYRKLSAQAFKAAYISHQNEVFDYFKSREKDLLVIDLGKDEPWPKLCEFLGKEIPNTSFPHKGKTPSAFARYLQRKTPDAIKQRMPNRLKDNIKRYL